MITAKTIMIGLLMKFSVLLTDVDPVNSENVNSQYVEQMYCLSLNTYFEARGESFEAKVAVAQSVMERVDNDEEFRRYNDACSVVKKAIYRKDGLPKRYQCWYSWYCDGLPDRVQLYHPDGTVNILEKKAWEESILASFYAYHHMYPNVAPDATHYYNDKLAEPNWADHYEIVARIGNHVFMK